MYGACESRRDFRRRVEEQIRHQRFLSADAVGEETEQQRADWPEHQRQREREDDRLVSDAEIRRDGRQRVGDEEEIERVERPAEEARGDGGAVALLGRRRVGRLVSLGDCS